MREETKALIRRAAPYLLLVPLAGTAVLGATLPGLGQDVNSPRRPAEAVVSPPSPPGVFRDCGECPEMVRIPSGHFLMGSPTSERGSDYDEGQQHEAAIRWPLAVGIYEVTFAEWDSCVAAGGCGGYSPLDQGWGRGRQPAVNVSWNDAKSYTRWLSSRTGKDYRLLTEAEWEYAARAGTVTAYYTGATISTRQANFDSNQARSVGQYPPNAWGLYDVAGNVREWVEDCYVASYPRTPSPDASIAVDRDHCAARVLRGGSWLYTAQDLRSAARGKSAPESRGYGNGFRVARRADQ